jgi:hypothetical protein
MRYVLYIYIYDISRLRVKSLANKFFPKKKLTKNKNLLPTIISSLLVPSFLSLSGIVLCSLRSCFHLWVSRGEALHPHQKLEKTENFVSLNVYAFRQLVVGKNIWKRIMGSVP